MVRNGWWSEREDGTGKVENKSQSESIFVRFEMTQNLIYILKSFHLHQEVDQTFFIRCRPFKLCTHTHNHN